MDSTFSSSHNPLPKPYSSFDKWLNIPCDDLRSSKTTPMVQCIDPKAHVIEYWEHMTRPDARLFTQGRATQVVCGMLKHSAGSALVSLNGSRGDVGCTKVLAATTFNIGQPSPEQPDEGEVVVQVSGTGGKNFGADSKPQQHHWNSLQSWLQRTLEQDEGMARSLNLLTGKACLRLVVTVIVLEDNGNVKDGALLACMAAWKDTRLPQVGNDLTEVEGTLWSKRGQEAITSLMEHNDMVGQSTRQKSEGPDDVRDYRISLTMGVWVNPTDHTIYLIADPSNCEAPFLEGTITIVVSLQTHKLQIDYTGKVPLTANNMALAAKMADARAKEVAKIL